MERLDRLGHASSKADEGPRESPRRARAGTTIPSSAPADAPLPRAQLNVLVTGGSRGIGRAIALRFARDGARRVAIGYLRNDRAAEETAAELARRRRRAGARARQRDLAARARRGGRARAARRARPQRGDGRRSAPALEVEDKHWDWTLNANARALLAADACRGAADAAPARRSSRSRRSAHSACSRTTSLVGTSKAALEALVRYLAVELAPRGIRVNAVSGGVVETGALEHFPNREQMLAAGAANPVGRLVEPDDVAGVVAFLCSPDAEMIRGQTLIVDGGFSLLA